MFLLSARIYSQDSHDRYILYTLIGDMPTNYPCYVSGAGVAISQRDPRLDGQSF